MEMGAKDDHTHTRTQTHLNTPNPCRLPFRHSPSYSDPPERLRIHGGTPTVWRLTHTHIDGHLSTPSVGFPVEESTSPEKNDPNSLPTGYSNGTRPSAIAQAAAVLAASVIMVAACNIPKARVVSRVSAGNSSVTFK
eukprot:GHVU01141901.1.p1 GENE.GHVU01141901.1~~GHVU01141901.1.p1  ORF type:complete len:137 (+),score=9.67 GHVU01141901.1:284-694(+)